MQRETKEIVTPSGHSIVIKSWISAREANIVKQPMLHAMKVNANTGETTSEITGDFLIDQEKSLINVLVVSIDGKTEGLTDILLDLPNADYQFAIAEINKIYSANLTQAK